MGPGDMSTGAPLRCLPDPGQRHTTGPCTRTVPSFLRGIGRRHTAHRPLDHEGGHTSCVSTESAIKNVQETKELQDYKATRLQDSKINLKKNGDSTQRTIISKYIYISLYVYIYIRNMRPYSGCKMKQYSGSP